MERKTTAWINHDGTALPPPPDAVVIVRYRDGIESMAWRAKALRWTHDGSGDDVVAYRVLAYD